MARSMGTTQCRYCTTCGVEYNVKRSRYHIPVYCHGAPFPYIHNCKECSSRRREQAEKREKSNPTVDCPICGKDMRRSSLKAHQKGGDCRVAAMRKLTREQGLVSSWLGAGDLCRSLGIRVEHGPSSHHSGGWGRRAHTSENDFVPDWAHVIIATRDTASRELLPLQDRAFVLALAASDAELCDALVAADHIRYSRDPDSGYPDPDPVLDMVLSLIPVAREQVTLPAQTVEVVDRFNAEHEQNPGVLV